MKVAVLGLGSAGGRHARNLIDLGHDVIGFDPAMPDAGEVELADSLQSAIAATEAVVVASPNSLHAEQALSALQQRRHVLVEKPLTVSATDAERIVAASEHADVASGVAMNLRFHPGILELKRLVDDGTLGTIRLVRASFGYDLRLWHRGDDYRKTYSARADLGGGIVLDAIHEIDYLLWLFGPAKAVSAETAHVSDLEIDVEDVALAALKFESGALGAVDLNFFEPVYRRGCLVVGSRSVACWNWTNETVVVTRDVEDERIVEVACDVADTYRATMADFIDSLERGTTPRTSMREGLAAVRVAETLKASACSGRRLAFGCT